MSIPATANAIGFNRTGDYNVIEKLTIPFKPTPSDIVVKTEYLGINFLDTHLRSGAYGPPHTVPSILGAEAAGTIVALPTDERVLNDPDYKKRGYKVGGRVAVLHQFAAHADYVAFPFDYIHPVPDSVPSKVAAATLLQGLTALSFVEEAYEVKKGDTVLIHTVAGGTGLLFAQMSKARGATVIGTTSTKEKAALARVHGGVDHVILYKQENVVQRVLELTNGEGVEAVFDAVGKDTFEGNFRLLKRKGTFVSYGSISGNVPPIQAGWLGMKNLKFVRAAVPNYLVTADELLYYTTKLWKAVEAGDIDVLIHKEYPFTTEGARETHKDIVEGKNSGKLLIKVE